MGADRRYGLVVITVLLTSCSSSWANQPLPDEIKVDSVLGSSDEIGFREGCGAAVFRLSADVAKKINAEGLSYFPKYADVDPHGGWRETPGEVDVQANGHGAKVTFFGLYATGGCDNQSHPELHSSEIVRALQKPGSFYRSGGNLEEIIVVVPQERLVGHYYFG